MLKHPIRLLPAGALLLPAHVLAQPPSPPEDLVAAMDVDRDTVLAVFESLGPIAAVNGTSFARSSRGASTTCKD